MTLQDVYIGGQIIWMFAAEQSDPTRWRFPSETSVLNFFLKSGLRSLETDNTWPVQFMVPPSTQPVLKIFVAPTGHPYCKGYPSQFKYRMQVIPGLRRKGVGEDKCIAVEYLPAPTAPVRVELSGQPKAGTYGRTMYRSAVTVSGHPVDGQTTLLSQTDVLFSRSTGFGKYGQEHYAVNCQASLRNIEALVASAKGSGNPSISRAITIDLPPDERRSSPAFGNESERRAFVEWTKDARSVSEGSMDASGVLWLDDAYERGPTSAITKSGLMLRYYKDGTIFSKPLALPESWAWANGYKIERKGGQIHLALVNRMGSPQQAHLWIVLDDNLTVSSVVMFDGDLWPRKL